MSREFQVYQGAAPQSAQVQAKQVPYFGNIPQNGAAVDAAIGEAKELGVKLGRLHDLGLQQRVKQEWDKIRTDMDVEMRQAADVAWGSEESLFRKDGSVNSDRYDAIVAKYWDACDRIEPGEFVLGENAVRYAGEKEDMRNDIALGMMRFTAMKKLENTRKAFADNLELAVGREDWEGARGLVEDARGSLLNDTEAEIELMKLKRGQLRAVSRTAGYGYPTSVNVGGTEYSGLSAALAMEDARGRKRQGNGGATARLAKGDADGAKEEGGGDGDTSEIEALTATPVQDMRGALTLMPLEEFGEVSDAFSFDTRVLTLPQGDGGVRVEAAPYAPECVQRVAAVGNARGGVDAEQARMMVARIALDRVADNPGVTDAQVLSMFDDAGIYESMGEGDAAVGKERCRSIVGECLVRGRGDSKGLGMAAIEPMIKAHLNSREFAESREWGRVLALNPRLEKGAVWDKSDLDDDGRKRWFALYDVYRKYRQEYKPDATGEPDKDEFEENAQAFYDWYKKDKLPGLRMADMEAASDWYKLQVVSRLQEKVYESGGDAAYSGYSGYGTDVQVARDVLRTLPPERLGADELMEVVRRNQSMDEARSEKFRQRARDEYERLRGLKQDFAENSKAAAKKREREAAAERRKAEKAARDAEKQAERVVARKLYVARCTPRFSEWVWDRENAADGASPCCRVPESEYKRLQEDLGFDGSQLVYVQVNGGRLLVTGVSKSGRLELNAPAVAKVQKKPNSKKKERWKTGGGLEYSYYFKSTEAK